MPRPTLFSRISNALTGRPAPTEKRILISKLSPTTLQSMRTIDLRPQPSLELEALTTDLQGYTGEWQELLADLSLQVQGLDERYQHFVQKRINPLFGRLRDQQQKLLHNDTPRPISPQEQSINRHLAGNVALLGTALVGQFFFPVLAVPVILTGFVLSIPIYRSAYDQWKQHRRIRLIHCGTVSNLVMWFGGYYAWGAFGLTFWQLGQKMLAMTQEQAHSTLIDVLRLQPGTVWLRVDGMEVEVPFAQVQAGDTLVLHAGQVIPVDGTILAGVALIDQHMLTGESQPAEKSIGETVLAATVVLSGIIDVRVEKTRGETMAAQIGQILNQATAYQVAYQADVLEQSQKYVLPMLGVSALSLPLIGPAPAAALLSSNYMVNMQLFGPGTLWSFLNIASSGGVLVKDGSAIVQMKEIDTIVFDKTGTLTLDQPQIAQIFALDGWQEEDVLRLAAAAEARQTHPIARAILNAAAERNLIPPPIAQAHYEIGYGIKVWIAGGTEEVASDGMQDDRMQDDRMQDDRMQDDRMQDDRMQTATDTLQLVRLGSGRFMQMEGIELSDAVQGIVTESQQRGHSLVMLAVDERLVGCIELAPTIRGEAKAIVDQLRQRGLALYIISGDQEAPTRQLAEELGMTGYFANTLPTQKAELVEKLQQEGRKVCFIGDGINDTIAMRKAMVSISLCGATTAATDTAKIVLMDGNLTQLLPMFELVGQFDRTMTRTTRNFAFFSALTVTGLLFFHFTYGFAALLENLAVGTSIGIALRPLYDNPMLTTSKK